VWKQGAPALRHLALQRFPIDGRHDRSARRSARAERAGPAVSGFGLRAGRLLCAISITRSGAVETPTPTPTSTSNPDPDPDRRR
jgi:hypothetical protein